MKLGTVDETSLDSLEKSSMSEPFGDAAPFNVPFPHSNSPVNDSSTIDIEEFNLHLQIRLGDPAMRIIGNGFLTKTLVRVGSALCKLAPETTAAGALAYLAAVSDSNGVYSVVASSKHVARRVVPGRYSERIPGFYFYSQTSFKRPQVVEPITPQLDDWDVAMLILEAVAVLHRSGHQRLRIYPNLSDIGGAWRTGIVDVDHTRIETWGTFHWPEWEADSFAYTQAAGVDVCGMLVDANSTPTQVARHILSFFPDRARSGLRRDWEYAGWYVELLGSARENHNLPVGDGRVWVDGIASWRFYPSARNSIPEPPPLEPQRARR